MKTVDPHIVYSIIVCDVNKTLFQGFSMDWINLNWVFDALVDLPTTVIEPSLDFQQTLSDRAAGLLRRVWMPLDLSGLRKLRIMPQEPFHVVFSNSLAAEKEILAWAGEQTIPPLLVTKNRRDGFMALADLNYSSLSAHFINALNAVGLHGSRIDLTSIAKAIAAWKAVPKEKLELIERDSPSVWPNNMVLRSAGYILGERAPLHRPDDLGHIVAIGQSFCEVERLIRSFEGNDPQRSFHRPPLIVSLPTMARGFYERASLDVGPKAELGVMRKVFGHLQREKSFGYERLSAAGLDQSDFAKFVLQLRGNEICLHSAAVGLRAATTLSPTIRLRPGVNHIVGGIKQMAQTIDWISVPNVDRKQKLRKLFEQVESQLTQEIGNELQLVIMCHDGEIKIVADVPVEWALINNLPLGLRYDCSRIPATPGDLMIRELCKTNELYFSTNDPIEILVISSFESNDKWRDCVSSELGRIKPGIESKIQIIHVRVADEDDFIKAMTSYTGGIVIFDGHGIHDKMFGHLRISGKDLPLWQNQKRFRVPPVVILSACMSHAATQSTYTAASYFLLLGARTVLATLLPINPYSAANFVGRLLHDLAWNVAPAARRRSRFTWCNFIGIVLRMQAVSDFLHYLETAAGLSEADSRRLKGVTHEAVWSGESRWFERMISELASTLGSGEEHVGRIFLGSLPYFDTLRYIQLGNPETLLFKDGAPNEPARAVESTEAPRNLAQ